MTITQYLGAFNDNIFKQLVLLICVDYVRDKGMVSDPFQATAAALFAIPFVMFSGLAGFISDKRPKRNIVVLSKCAEIVVMGAGLIAFFVGPPGSQTLIAGLMIVLFLMGMQSAFFGPSKYGILPELLKDDDLPAANGYIQMTTFLAIILGVALSGTLKDAVGDRLWLICLVCIGIAIAGTFTSLLVRRTPCAHPDLAFSASCLAIEKSAWRLLLQDKLLTHVLFVYAFFWFAGGVVLPTVNFVGKQELGLSDRTTSLIQSSTAIGIAIGCVFAGKFSRGKVRFGLVFWGAVGMLLALVAATIVCIIKMPTSGYVTGLSIALFVTGFSAGLFALPLQVFIQIRPPDKLKGRILGAMNFLTWIGILLSAGVYAICSFVFPAIGLGVSATLACLGIFVFLVGITFRPKYDPVP